MEFASWGNYPKVRHKGFFAPGLIEEARERIQSAGEPLLPRGNGRSYGDACLNENGYLFWSKNLHRFSLLDADAGILRCESGVTLAQILQTFLAKGWFLPVTPGTKFVSVGGAIANDVHGKNQHCAGNFGNHVQRLALLRSDGTVIECSPTENSDWFWATIGGLGLTGFILWADIRLRQIPGPLMQVTVQKFSDWETFFTLSQTAMQQSEYSVAWIDAMNFGKRFGHGLLMQGNHRLGQWDVSDRQKPFFRLKLPEKFSRRLLFPALVRIYNQVHAQKYGNENTSETQTLEEFFYPLDKIENWNRLYGRRGFLQWQCVIPEAAGLEPVKAIFGQLRQQRIGAYLAVAKMFGDTPVTGLLSFPQAGITLALDFPNTGETLFRMLQRLDQIVLEAGGRLYPAKDARMSAAMFRASFPNWETFLRFVDPKISSSFSRRVLAPAPQYH